MLFTKNLPNGERHRIKNKSKRAERRIRQNAAARDWRELLKVSHAMMQESFKHGRKIGRWSDEWFSHPIPTLNEPEKLVSWMTPRDSVSEDRKADMFLRAGLPRVDTTFAKTRRLLNAFERSWTGGRACPLERLRALQPGDGTDLPNGIQNLQQLRPPRRRWPDAGDALGPDQATG